MTRNPLPSIAVTMILLAAAAAPAAAQGRGPDRAPIRFYADLGYINLFDYPKWILIGPEVEFRLGGFLSLNPDVALWIQQSAGTRVAVVPGATLNVHLGRWSFGGGGGLKVNAWDTMAAGVIVPKFQVGYLAGPARVSAQLYYLGTTKDAIFSFTIALRLGGGPRRGPED
jgi:hypothetical protein